MQQSKLMDNDTHGAVTISGKRRVMPRDGDDDDE